jgi:hypothetical protein
MLTRAIFSLGLAAFGAAAFAADETADKRDTSPASAGLKVYRDPASGRLLPAPATAAQQEIARSGLGKRDDALMREEAVPGHGVLLHANGQLRMSSVVRRDADGKLVESCVTSAAEPSQ